jgi:uncharacterized membrane protein YbaN (DUF454 family)
MSSPDIEKTDEVHPTRRYGGLFKLLLLLVGHLSLALGLLGIVLPVLPTTPFLLLSAACYARGSESMYHWLIHQRVLGPYISSYREGRGFSRTLKLGLILVIWISISLSAMLLSDKPQVLYVLFGSAAFVSILILCLPGRIEISAEDENR